MSLFTYTERPYQEETSSSEEEEDGEESQGSSLFQTQFQLSKRKYISQYKPSALKKKSKPAKSGNKSDEDKHEKDSVISLDSSSDDEAYEKKPDQEENGEATLSAKAKQVVDTIMEEKSKVVESRTNGKPIGRMHIDLPSIEKYQALLAKIRSKTGTATSTTLEVKLSAADIANSRKRATSHAMLQHLPQVRTQAQRISSVPKSLNNDQRSSSGNGNLINFVIRLNGKHTRKWQIGLHEKFVDMKAKFRNIYGLDGSVKVDMRDPNGDVLKDNNTPHEIEMEEDDMIDATIPQSKVEEAISHASSAKPGRSADSIRFVTRLNGKHIWKWQIPKAESFGKMKAKFRSIYGLDDAVKISMVDPDGEVLTDQSTPSNLGLEHEDMIDVTIPENLFQNAVSRANEAKHRTPAKNYVSSVSSQLSQAPEEELEEDEIHLTLVVPSDLCSFGEDTCVPVNASSESTLSTLHEHILGSSILKSNRDSYWYSVQPNVPIDLEATLGTVLKSVEHSADGLLLFIHKKQQEGSLASTVMVYIHDKVNNAHKEDSEIACVKVKLSQTCQKLMTTVAQNCLNKSIDSLRFVLTSGQKVLKPSMTFQELGVRDGDQIDVMSKH